MVGLSQVCPLAGNQQRRGQVSSSVDSESFPMLASPSDYK